MVSVPFLRCFLNVRGANPRGEFSRIVSVLVFYNSVQDADDHHASRTFAASEAVAATCSAVADAVFENEASTRGQSPPYIRNPHS